MNTYKRHRFRPSAPPPDTVAYAVWLYHHFNLSHSGIEDGLTERNITVSAPPLIPWSGQCPTQGLPPGWQRGAQVLGSDTFIVAPAGLERRRLN